VLAAWAALLLTAGTARSYDDAFTTAEDWKTRMSLREKFISIVAPMSEFHRYGVPFRRPAQEYIPALDRVIAANPQLDDEEVANIFASTVYLYEPESRPYFDMLEDRFLRGDTEFKAVRLRPSE
jgi:hypothetical protein